ncbi:hypothetical protein F4703DRAFT_1885709 [Phycomyces blakesleeanus]
MSLPNNEIVWLHATPAVANLYYHLHFKQTHDIYCPDLHLDLPRIRPMVLSLVSHLDTHSNRPLVIYFMEAHSSIKIRDFLKFLCQLRSTIHIIHCVIRSGLFQSKLLLGSAAYLLNTYRSHPKVLEWSKQCSVPFTDAYADIVLPKEQIVSHQDLPLSTIADPPFSPFTRQALFVKIDKKFGTWSENDGLVFHFTFLNVLQSWQSTISTSRQALVMLIDEKAIYGDIPNFFEFSMEKQEKILECYRNTLNKSLEPFSVDQPIHSYFKDYRKPKETIGESMAWLQGLLGLSISTSIYLSSVEEPDQFVVCPPYFKNLCRIYLNQQTNLTADEWTNKFLDLQQSSIDCFDSLVYISAETLNLPNPESKQASPEPKHEPGALIKEDFRNQGIHFTIRSFPIEKHEPKNEKEQPKELISEQISLSKDTYEPKEQIPIAGIGLNLSAHRHLPSTFETKKEAKKRKKGDLPEKVSKDSVESGENVKPEKKTAKPTRPRATTKKRPAEDQTINSDNGQDICYAKDPKDAKCDDDSHEMIPKTKRKYTPRKKGVNQTVIKGDDEAAVEVAMTETEPQSVSEIQTKKKRKYTKKTPKTTVEMTAKGDDLFTMFFLETYQPKEGYTPRENMVTNEKFKESAGMQKKKGDMYQCVEFPGTQPLGSTKNPSFYTRDTKETDYDSDATDDGSDFRDNQTSFNVPPAPSAPSVPHVPLSRSFTNTELSTVHDSYSYSHTNNHSYSYSFNDSHHMAKSESERPADYDSDATDDGTGN